MIGVPANLDARLAARRGALPDSILPDAAARCMHRRGDHYADDAAA